MGIMPLREDVWSQGKCGLKLMQYMASGLPSVVHPVGVTQEMIEDGVNGFLKTTREEWSNTLDRLACDVDLRRTVGKKARQTAQEKYALSMWGPKVAQIIDGL
jgi:glycosyltransferase involved in cell wall biosynthesis